MLSYVKEKIKEWSYLTLMIKKLSMYLHPRHPSSVLEIKSSITVILKGHCVFLERQKILNAQMLSKKVVSKQKKHYNNMVEI